MERLISIDAKFIHELIKSRLTFDMHLILNTLKEGSYDLFNEYNRIKPIGQSIYQWLHREDYIKSSISKHELYTINNIELSLNGLELFKEDVDGLRSGESYGQKELLLEAILLDLIYQE